MTEEELKEIKEDFISKRKDLEKVGKYYVDTLSQVENVHVLNYRVKDPDHLIEKIQRKTTAGRYITIDNYSSEITDLVGIRVLHVFKDGWKEIDDYLRKKYNSCFKETPIFYYRSEEEKSDNTDFKWVKRENGYRSIHYVIDHKDGNDSIPVEIQVRTIFEEAWGEIDHKIVYPELTDDKAIKQYSIILNRLASLGDEIGLNLRDIKQTFEKQKKELLEQIDKKKNDADNSGFGAGIFTGVVGAMLLNYILTTSKNNSELKNETIEDKKSRNYDIDHIIPINKKGN